MKNSLLALNRCTIIPVGGLVKWGLYHVLLHWTLSLSVHRVGKIGSGMTDHQSSAQAPALVLTKWGVLVAAVPRWKDHANIGMTLQGSFHIIHPDFYVSVRRDCPTLTSHKFNSVQKTYFYN